MKTKIWSALVALIAGLLVAPLVSACGDDDDDDNDDNDTGDDDDSGDDDDDDDDSADAWYDSSTGLTWQNGPDVGGELYTWHNAQNHCAGLSWGGYDDWRLPSISNLRSLVAGCDATATDGACGVTDECLSYDACRGDSCEGCDTLDGPGSGGMYWPSAIRGSGYFYWTSSAIEDVSDSAWAVAFDSGAVYDAGIYSDQLGARCVR